MATAECLLSDQTFKCSICLEVLTWPVSTPCGHNFCNECIQKYWDVTDICQCPYCKNVFPHRPELRVNTVLNELVEQFKALAQPQGSDSDPLKNLEERLCKSHDKPRELYCRTDREFVCTACFETDHKGHDVVSLEEEFDLAPAVAGLQRMIEERSQKKAELEESVKEARKQKKNIMQYADVMQINAEHLVIVIQNKFLMVAEKSREFLMGLEKEIDELEKKKLLLETLPKSRVYHDAIQNFPTLSTPLVTDWSNVSVSTDLSVQIRALAQLEKTFEELTELPEIKRQFSGSEHEDLLTQYFRKFQKITYCPRYFPLGD